MRETTSPDRDLESLPNVYDPFPLYAWLRDHDLVHWSSSLNAWAVTRYDDVRRIEGAGRLGYRVRCDACRSRLLPGDLR